MSEYLTFEPVDVVIPRGNRLFGGGVHGQAAMPPWPSLFAGAIASRALADAGIIKDITARPDHAETILSETLGAHFALAGLGLERNGEAFFPLPADLVVLPGKEGDKYQVRRIVPRRLKEGPSDVATSAALLLLPVLQDASREKPITGLWVTAAGLARHLAGDLPNSETLVKTDELWKTDSRLGIALDRGSRTAAESALYTTDAVVLAEGVRFVAGFTGNNLPSSGLVRLGGDGRGARIALASKAAAEQFAALGQPRADWPGFRMILATPGIFPAGWLPPKIDPATRRLEIDGLTAELVAAAVPRHQVISGWDLARHAPKPARKVVPSGSVYWFRVLEGDTAALASLRREGLLSLLPENSENTPESSENTARRREGFGRVWFGAWRPEEV